MKLKGLKRYSSNGHSYVYHRATGVLLGKDISETDPEFLKAYLEAESTGKPKPKLKEVQPNSVAGTCNRFLTSRKFKGLSKSYQNVLRSDAKRLCQGNKGKIGEVPMSSIKARHIESQMEALDRNPGNQRLKLWRYLFQYSIGTGAISTNPTIGIKLNPELRTGGHIPWTFSDITAFRKHWAPGTRQRLAFEIQYWAGARISDTRQLGPSSIDDAGWLNFTQTKTGSHVSVPISRALPHFAEAEDLAHLKSAMAAMDSDDTTWLATEAGKVRSAKGSSQWFAKAAREAGLDKKTSHGLRKSRMILHAENGATSKEIAAWSGHETLHEVERYIRTADKRRLLSPKPSALQTGKFL